MLDDDFLDFLVLLFYKYRTIKFLLWIFFKDEY